MAAFTMEGNQFLLNGNPFQIISGTIHYFRVVPDYWEDRLRKLRAMGCNTVETYIPWNMHEPQPGVFRFTGMLDIVRFLETAKRVGLYAIVRPSPFICAEWEFGGQPAWLLAGEEQIPVRTQEGPFLSLMERFYEALFPMLVPLQIDHDGPIILMQVENEYGAYGDDTEYMEKMSAIMRRHGATVPFITCNNFEQDLSRGNCPGALVTANFGSGTGEKFDRLAQANCGGPLMCTEFWIGWYDAWGDDMHHTTSAADAAMELDEILRRGSVNIYMAHGGTNFGFMNGANYYEQLTPDVTSYDYDAPIAEDGSITPKYRAFQKVIGQYTPLPELEVQDPVRASYGEVPVQGRAALLEQLDALSTPVELEEPCCMERLGQSYGYIIYSHKLETPVAELAFADAHDRVQVFADGKRILTLFDREIPGVHTVSLPAGTGLDILVENMGRVNYGPHLRDQRKGILGPVLADGRSLMGWQARSIELTDLDALRFAKPGRQSQSPMFHRFCFEADKAADTWLDTVGWGKGCAFINGFHLGRFWEKGPQRRLYIPAPLLKPGGNELIILETEGRWRDTAVLADGPELG